MARVPVKAGKNDPPWKTAADAVVYLLLRLVWALARAVPLGALRRGLEEIAAMIGRLDRRHRRVIDGNLSLAFPEWDEKRRERAVTAAFRNWGRIAAEVIHADEFTGPRMPAEMAELRREVERLAAGGRGVLVVTAHLANFELLARVCGRATGRRIWVFHRPLKNRFADRFLSRQRAAANVMSLGRGLDVREALRALERGEVVAAPLDQNQPRGHGVFVDFFGVPACTSTMLARLSVASGAAVLPVFAQWRGDALGIMIGSAIEPPPGVARRGAERATALRDLTRRYTAEIEAAVRRCPEQWNWAHRRWKTRPEGE